VLPILAALFIGRIGCFSMGVFEGAFGTETNGWTGLDQGDGILRHPIMLYELLFLLILFLWFLPKIKSFSSGDAFKHFMVLYLGFRLGIEFFKVRHVLWLGLSSIQWACLLGLIYYADYLIQNRSPFFKIKR
jgi:prolipoprotein diacylglyceryltransferase